MLSQRDTGGDLRRMPRLFKENAMSLETLKTDARRHFAEDDQGTGIYIRAKKDGKWDSVDIAELDHESLLTLLRSKDKEWVVGVVEIILGYRQ